METMVQHFSSSEKLYEMTVAPVCEAYGLTYMEYTVLLFLANNPGYDTAAEIVKYRHLTKSHVSMSVRSLQARGLIKGEYRESNRRDVHLVLLDAAAPIVYDGQAAQQAYFETLLGGFSDTEKSDFLNYIKRIHQNVADSMAAMYK